MFNANLLKEGFKYAPYLVCMIIVVFMFIWYLNMRDKRDMKKEEMIQEDFNKRDDALSEISKQNHEIHIETINVIKENSSKLGEVKHALDQANKNC